MPLFLALNAAVFCQNSVKLIPNDNGVTFSISDTLLKNLFGLAETKATQNVKVFLPRVAATDLTLPAHSVTVLICEQK